MPLSTVSLSHLAREKLLKSMPYGIMPSHSCMNGHSGGNKEAGPIPGLLITKSKANDAKRVFASASGMLLAATSMMELMDQVETIQRSGPTNSWRCRYATRCWLKSIGQGYSILLLSADRRHMVYVLCHPQHPGTT